MRLDWPVDDLFALRWHWSKPTHTYTSTRYCTVRRTGCCEVRRRYSHEPSSGRRGARLVQLDRGSLRDRRRRRRCFFQGRRRRAEARSMSQRPLCCLPDARPSHAALEPSASDGPHWTLAPFDAHVDDQDQHHRWQACPVAVPPWTRRCASKMRRRVTCLPSATNGDAALRRADTLGRPCSTHGLLFWSRLVSSRPVSRTLGLRRTSSPHVFSSAAPRRASPLSSLDAWLVPVHPTLGAGLALGGAALRTAPVPWRDPSRCESQGDRRPKPPGIP